MEATRPDPPFERRRSVWVLTFWYPAAILGLLLAEVTLLVHFRLKPPSGGVWHFNIPLAASLVCWLFVRREARELTSKEFWQLVVVCSVWQLVIEVLQVGVFFVSATAQERAMLRNPTFQVAGLAGLVLAVLFVWLSFRFPGMRLIARHLRKMRAAA